MSFIAPVAPSSVMHIKLPNALWKVECHVIYDGDKFKFAKNRKIAQKNVEKYLKNIPKYTFCCKVSIYCKFHPLDAIL